MSKDIRLQILLHFRDLNVSTEERIANQWLSQVHYDLGTIRRALIELILEGYLVIPGLEKDEAVTWLNSEMDSTTSKLTPAERHAKKSSMRLIKEVGGYPKVADIRLHTTIAGVVFIEKYLRDRNDIWIRVMLMLLGVVLGIIGAWIGKHS